MRLSTKSTYGLRAMLNIALKNEGVISIMDIARNEGISTSYLEQLLNRLRRDGLIESVRGPKGGYSLAKNPSRITVLDIIKTLEGNISPVHCVGSGKKTGSVCVRKNECVPKMVWLKLAKAINNCLRSITLEDLCKESRKARFS